MSGTGGRAGAANVPKDYRLVTVANSPARESQAEVYKMVDGYVDSLKRQFPDEYETQVKALMAKGVAEDDARNKARIKSLFLYSENPGTGKTTTASAILNAYLTTHYLGSKMRGDQPDQQPTYFLDVNNLQTDYNQFNRPRVPETVAEPAAKRYYSAMEKAKNAPFTVLDDVGLRDCTDAFRGDLHAIINHRVTNQLPTIYTSNLPIVSDVPEKEKVQAFMPYDLVDVFGERRLADRMRDMCAVLSFAGESKRGRR